MLGRGGTDKPSFILFFVSLLVDTESILCLQQRLPNFVLPGQEYLLQIRKDGKQLEMVEDAASETVSKNKVRMPTYGKMM